MSNELLNMIKTTTSTLERYARVDELIKELTKEKASLRKDILDIMSNEDKLVQGEFVAIKSEVSTTRINTKALYAEFGEDNVKELYGTTSKSIKLTVN